MFGGFQVGAFQPAYQQVQVTADAPPATGGGFWYAFELQRATRELRKRREKKREEEIEAIENAVDREIARLLAQQEVEAAERAEIERMRVLVARFADRQAEEAMTERVRTAFIRAATQQNVSAILALQREFARMVEEEEITALLMLLNDE